MSPQTTSFNNKLDTNYVDLGGAEKDSYGARYTKAVTGFVGDYVTPRQLLSGIRILKAVTFVFLVLTLVANIMYITFLEVLASKEVRNIVGGRRDMIIRVYGLFLSIVTVAIEADYAVVVNVSCVLFRLVRRSSDQNPFFHIPHDLFIFNFFRLLMEICLSFETLQALHGFKGFVPKALLIFFVSAITGANPLYIAERNAILNSNVYYDDDVVAASTAAIPDIPMSVVNFQRVTSFFL